MRVRPIKSSEKKRTCIFVTGGTDGGFPADWDWWTERMPYTWGWKPWNDATEVLKTSYEKYKGTYSIRGRVQWDASIYFGLRFDLDAYPKSYLDLKTDNRFTKLFVHWKNSFGSTQYRIMMEDKNGVVIRCKTSEYFYDWAEWYISVNVPIHAADSEIEGAWQYITSGTFDWSAVKNLRFLVKNRKADDKLWVDRLFFKGRGLKIDPFKHPNLNPAWRDTTEKPYPSVHHYRDEEGITCFEQAWKIGESLLNLMKRDYQEFGVEAFWGYPWASPGKTLTFNLPSWDINSASYKILKLTHEWRSRGNRLKTIFELAPSTLWISSKRKQEQTLSGLLAKKKE